MSRDRRIAKELADIQADKDSCGVFAVPVNEADLTHLQGSFPAPPDTPYAGGTYNIDITIPDTYPFKAPRMIFSTKIWHPNVSSQTGAICLDTLGTAWSPVQTIKTALLSIRMLLEVPNPKDPQDAEVASMLMKNPERFARIARDWAIKHAGATGDFDLDKWLQNQGHEPPKVADDSKYMGYNKNLVDRFVHMGFQVEAVVEAFLYVGIDRNGGEDYELEEAFMGDVTARLLGEQ